jgi:hypothetical protein
MVGSPEIQDIQFRENNKIWSAGDKVCEVVLGYICNMEIYSAEGKKLEDTVLSLRDRKLGQNYHIYQDSFIIV